MLSPEGASMRRREFLGALSGAAATWPFAARAQRVQRMRRVGVLIAGAEEPENRARYGAFLEELRKLGWTDGRNLQIDYRWGAGNAANIRKYAAELVALAPNVIFVSGTAAIAPMLQVTRTVPIVFVNVGDPVGAGYVESLAQPGGNATGFTQFEYSLSGKWPELLKEIAPGVKRVAVLRDAALSSGIGQFAVIQAVAPSLGLEVRPINNVIDAGELERSIAAFARVPNSGLIATASGLTNVHRALIIRLAAQYKLPAVYPFRPYCPSRRADGLWARSHRPISTRCRLRRPNPKGCEICRSAGADTDQVRNSDQSQDSESAWT